MLGGEIWNVGVVDFVLLACLKRSSTFLRKKVHPRDNRGYAYEISFIDAWTGQSVQITYFVSSRTLFHCETYGGVCRVFDCNLFCTGCR